MISKFYLRFKKIQKCGRPFNVIEKKVYQGIDFWINSVNWRSVRQSGIFGQLCSYVTMSCL